MTKDLAGYLRYAEVFASSVRGGVVSPLFRPDGERFCYADGDPERVEFWAVDPARGVKSPLFDTARLRKSLEAEFGHALPFDGAPFTSLEFVDDVTIRVEVQRQPSGLSNPQATVALDPDAARWVVDVDLTTYDVKRLPSAEIQRRRRAAPRNVRPGRMASDLGPGEVPSPDGKWFLGESGNNLAIRSIADDLQQTLTSDGEPDQPWIVDEAVWSPDSSRVIALHVDTRACERVPVVHWLKPVEQVESRVFTKIGGPLPLSTPAIIDVRRRAVTRVSLPGEPDQTILPAGWRRDGSEAYLLTTDRRQRYLRLYAVPVGSAEPRLVCEETQDTFIVGIRAIPRFTKNMLLDDDKRLLWFSERDGWRHLYLYDTDGRELAQVTDGEFEVLTVLAVNLETEDVFFTAQGWAERPYDIHLCRAKLDGSVVERLTSATGVHAPVPTPNQRFFVDVHSAVDRPPSTDLLALDGRVVMTLARADVAGMSQLDSPEPEPFTVLAADGVTPLHGVLYRPPGFDPNRRYPVISDIYGGPQSTVHQVDFTDRLGVQARARASLGFVVYTVDGRGTPGRGKRFQDVAHGRFGEFYLEDHRHVLTELVRRYPFMDAARVGVIGGSWGGYNTVRSLLLAPDLYHVGVAICPVYDLFDHAAEALEPYMGLPTERPAEFAAGSSLDLADRLEGKLLMIHGTSDVNATFSATMKMCDALVRANKPYDLVVLPDADHHFLNAGKHAWEYFQTAAMRYLVTHLRPELSE